jgi:hypothetical protein
VLGPILEHAGCVIRTSALRLTVWLLAVAFASTASARDQTSRLLARAWPSSSYTSLEELGTGVGVVFTPDLSVRGNCRFYKALGFACFESADWLEVLRGIHEHNSSGERPPIHTLLLETHGTNGHGLKLQNGKKPRDHRSYIAVAALQEILEPVGVRYIIISACNSGRLLRPEIYRRLDRDPGDILFLPPTLGVIDATDDFDPRRSKVTVITPANSAIETTLVGSFGELDASARRRIEAAAKKRNIILPNQFAISEMLIRILLRSPELELRTGAHVEEKSDYQTPARASEELFQSFVAHLESLASRGDAGVATAASAR